MFCRKCGKQIPDGATFCTYCGAQQGAPVQPQPGQTAPDSRTRQQGASQEARQQTPPYTQQQSAAQGTGYQAAQTGAQKPKSGKKGISILIPVLVFLVFAVLGRFVLAPALRSGSDSKDSQAPAQVTEDTGNTEAAEDTGNTGGTEDAGNTEDTGEGETDGETEINPAYTEVFLGSRVVHLPFMIGMDMECFAMKDEDGNIICRDYGYQGDRVLTYIETWYYPGIAADQQEMIQSYDEAAQGEAARFNGISCAEITYEYNEENEFYKIKYAFKDLDQPENCQALYDAGLSTGADGLSLSVCEKMALDDGFIQK